MALDTLDSLKLGLMPATFLMMLGGCVFPWYLKRFKSALTYMAMCSCFAAGVVVGAAFSHILPDAQDAWSDYFQLAGSNGLWHSDDVTYPFAQLIGVFILLLLISADHLANAAHNKMSGAEGEAGGHDHHNHLVMAMAHNPDSPPKQPLQQQHEHHHHHEDIQPKPTIEKEEKEDCVSNNNKENLVDDTPKTATDLSDLDKHRGSKSQIIQAYIFFFALSIHSVFDGLSLGAEDNLESFYAIMVAIVAHKALDGLALGVPLFFANLPKFHTVLAIILCSLMTPLGIVIGLVTTEAFSGASGKLAQAIILSMSMGSFLFISLMEMLPAGLAKRDWSGTKLGLTFVGWGLMAFIAIFT